MKDSELMLLVIQPMLDDMEIYTQFIGVIAQAKESISCRSLEFFFKFFIQSNPSFGDLKLHFNQMITTFGTKHFQFFNRGARKNFKSKHDDQIHSYTPGHIHLLLWIAKNKYSTCIQSNVSHLRQERKNSNKALRKTKDKRKKRKSKQTVVCDCGRTNSIKAVIPKDQKTKYKRSLSS